MTEALIQFILIFHYQLYYLSAIETLICHTDIEVNRAYFFRFCTKYLMLFLKYGVELIVALSSTNAIKLICRVRIL